jgi:hypothetical protein
LASVSPVSSKVSLPGAESDDVELVAAGSAADQVPDVKGCLARRAEIVQKAAAKTGQAGLNFSDNPFMQ